MCALYISDHVKQGEDNANTVTTAYNTGLSSLEKASALYTRCIFDQERPGHSQHQQRHCQLPQVIPHMCLLILNSGILYRSNAHLHFLFQLCDNWVAHAQRGKGGV